MDARPIGVFDSGLGGLTTVKKLIELMPGEDIIYLGDTGRVPYGSRSRETIIRYARQDAAFLMKHNIKAVVIACNTVCSAASVTDIFGDSPSVPVYEVVSAPARTAALSTKNNRVGVIGTKATIHSRAYEIALKSISPDVRVFPAACPLFVPLVEDGLISDSDDAVLSIANRYLESLRDSDIDTLLLGCTHYPLLHDVISKVMGSGVMLVDSGAETAKYLSASLSGNALHSPGDREARLKFFVTDSIEGFEPIASRFLESDIRGMVEQISLDSG